MIIQVVKDKVWVIKLRKSPHGKVLDSFPLSQSLLMRISLDYLVNLNDSQPWTMDVDTSLGPYKLSLKKVEGGKESISKEPVEVVAPLSPQPGDDTFTREEPKALDDVIEEVVSTIDPNDLEMEEKKDGN